MEYKLTAHQQGLHPDVNQWLETPEGQRFWHDFRTWAETQHLDISDHQQELVAFDQYMKNNLDHWYDTHHFSDTGLTSLDHLWFDVEDELNRRD